MIPDKEKQVIVFLHGWATDKSIWANQVDFFKDNYNVIPLDLRGYGANPYEPAQNLLEAMADDVAKGKEAGFDDYLTKPIQIKEFMEVLKRYLEQ